MLFVPQISVWDLEAEATALALGQNGSQLAPAGAPHDLA